MPALSSPGAVACNTFSRGLPAWRRICPGRYFADAALFLNVARVLHVFDISPPRDAAGQPIRIEPKMKDGFLS